jgi:hypothetical protein
MALTLAADEAVLTLVRSRRWRAKDERAVLDINLVHAFKPGRIPFDERVTLKAAVGGESEPARLDEYAPRAAAR